MMMNAREYEKEWEHMLDWDGYQETTANLLLHRQMKTASSKMRKDVKSRVTRKIVRSEVYSGRQDGRLIDRVWN